MRYQFTPDLATGNSIIDAEHTTLLEAADALMQEISAGKGKENLEKSITYLLDYTQKHFKHEEELQIQSRYAEYSTHKQWHKQFVKDLQDKANHLKEKGADSILVLELVKTMGNLVNHIKTFDKKLADYLKTA